MTATAKPRSGVRAQQGQQTRQKILKAATKIFAKNGYDRGSIESISKAAKSHDRMIYYYFGSKEKLFVAVLESLYDDFNEAESTLRLNTDDPMQALGSMVDFMWSYYISTPQYIQLLAAENLQRGVHLQKSVNVTRMSETTLSLLGSVLTAGQAQGIFRTDVTIRNLHLMISSLAYFYHSNQYTLGAFFGEDLMVDGSLQDWQGFIIDAVLRKVCVDVAAWDARVRAQGAVAAVLPVPVRRPRGRPRSTPA